MSALKEKFLSLFHTPLCKIIGLLWAVFFGGVLAFCILLICISNAWFGFSPLPTFEDLENPNNSLATEIYSVDNSLLGKIYIQDRSNIDYSELSAEIVNTLVASEDIRYYQHAGIDFKGLMRAVLFAGSRGGGSTITQQLAKNLFHKRANSFISRVLQKIKEWIIAVKLERSYTKEEIITMYLNTVPFSEGAYGVKSAARTYFNCLPSELNWQQSAVLVGMLQASTRYNPHRNPNNSLKKRNSVLGQVAKYNFINTEECDSIKQLPIIVDYNRMDHNVGPATYFREHVRAFVKKWAKREAEESGEEYDIYRDGLKIYTTINSKLQQYAEEAVEENMRELQRKFYKDWKRGTPWDDDVRYGQVPWKEESKLIVKAIKQSSRYKELKSKGLSEDSIQVIFNRQVPTKLFSYKGDIDTLITPLDSIKYSKKILHAGFIAVDPQTGYVRAWVGGINHKHFKYDNVRLGSKRQVGSTFKPFVYAVAIDNGYSPCKKLLNSPVTIVDQVGNVWEPRGSTSLDHQMVSLKKALANSLNWISATLIKEIGPQPVIDLAKRMGIESHMDPYYSICLGTPDISLQEMIGAYNTFNNKGTYINPTFITRIEDKNGVVIAEFRPKSAEVMSETSAYAMINLMQGVTQGGTAHRLRWKYHFDNQIAGKTGTTNDNSDGWFIGMVPQLTAGAWVGGDEKRIHFKRTSDGQGAATALPIWSSFMQKVYKDTTLQITKSKTFERPKARMPVELDCNAYDRLQQQIETPPDENYEWGDEFDDEGFF